MRKASRITGRLVRQVMTWVVSVPMRKLYLLIMILGMGATAIRGHQLFERSDFQGAVDVSLWSPLGWMSISFLCFNLYGAETNPDHAGIWEAAGMFAILGMVLCFAGLLGLMAY